MTSIKDNIAATTDPAAANDLTEGYGVGSEWYNTQTGQMWKAISVASGAAQWMGLRLAPPGRQAPIARRTISMPSMTARWQPTS